MAKKLTRKEKIALQQKQQEEGNFVPKKEKHVPKKGSLRLTLGIICAALGFILYVNTIAHDYVLDDYSLIVENQMTRKGASALPDIFKSSYRAGYLFEGNDLYRPLSKAMFAIEWGISPNSPSLSHFMNVLLFALTGFLLFFTLSDLMGKRTVLPFIITILFVAHPIHTEAVANIKSRDEILCFLFSILSVFALHRYVIEKKRSMLITSAVSFAFAMLSKESAITMLAVYPLVLFFFTEEKVSRNILPLAILGVTAFALLAVRLKVLGGLKLEGVSIMDNLLAGAHSGTEKFCTAVAIMGMYLQKLFLPHPLVSDASYNQIPLAGFGDWRFLVSFAAYAGLGIFAFLKWKQKDPIAFGILFFLITASLGSNILFLIGTSYGERLMYMPSLGFCMAAGVLLVRLLKIEEASPFTILQPMLGASSKVLTAAGVLVLLYGFKTVSRNADWANDTTLFSNDVNLSPNSTRAHYYLGNRLMKDNHLATLTTEEEKRKALLQAIEELKKAADIYPGFTDAYNKIALAYDKLKDSVNTEKYYRIALEKSPNDHTFHSNYGSFLFNRRRYADAEYQYREAIRSNPNYADAHFNLGSVLGQTGRFNDAIDEFNQTIQLDPEYATAYFFLGKTYENMGKKNEAENSYQKAQQLNPNLKR